MSLNRPMRPTRRQKRRLAFLAVCVTALLSQPVSAQEADADGRTTYPLAYFNRFAPANALDIANTVPGFTLVDGALVRGFSGAAGNVTINGSRPSGKSQSLSDFLRDIPASQVVQVELISGQMAGGEYRSRANVLNIVLADGATALSGALEASLRYPSDGVVRPAFNASVRQSRGDTALTGSLELLTPSYPNEGRDILYDFASGNVTEDRLRTNRHRREQLTAASSLGWEPSEDRSAHVNLRLSGYQEALRNFSHVSDGITALRLDTIENALSGHEFELGADASAPLLGGSGRAVLLLRGEQSEFAETLLREGPLGALQGGFAQNLDSETSESILRTTWARTGLFDWDVELAAEAAYNTLDSAFAIDLIDAAGQRTPLAIPASNVLVEETRGEISLTAARDLGASLKFDAGLALEQSHIAVSGDTASSRDLTFIRPSAALDWRPSSDWRLRAALERTVAQLNFSEFASNAELASNRVNSGNPNLEPERTWRSSLLAEYRFMEDALLSVTIGYDQVEAVQDRVPVDVGLDAAGNLGDGERHWLRAAFNTPLDTLAIEGGRLEAVWNWQSSSVTDPYTLTSRPFADELPWQFYLNFRQDRAAWAWGFSYINHGEIVSYRLNEVDSFWPGDQYVDAFVEVRPRAGMTLTLAGNDLFGNDVLRERTFFAPDRSTLTPNAQEFRSRNRGPTLVLTLRQQFA